MRIVLVILISGWITACSSTKPVVVTVAPEKEVDSLATRVDSSTTIVVQNIIMPEEKQKEQVWTAEVIRFISAEISAIVALLVVDQSTTQ